MKEVLVAVKVGLPCLLLLVVALLVGLLGTPINSTLCGGFHV
jgi:hypothetical protein